MSTASELEPPSEDPGAALSLPKIRNLQEAVRLANDREMARLALGLELLSLNIENLRPLLDTTKVREELGKMGGGE